MFNDNGNTQTYDIEAVTVTEESPQSHPKVTLLELPATQVTLANHYGVSKQTIGKWIKKISEEYSKLGLTMELKDENGLVTEKGFEEIEDYKNSGIANYRNSVKSKATKKASQSSTQTLKSQNPFTLLGDDTGALAPTNVIDITTAQTNRLSSLSDRCDVELENSLDIFMQENSDFFSSYLKSGIEIGTALGKKKALLTIKAMQNAESTVFNELAKKQAETLG